MLYKFKPFTIIIIYFGMFYNIYAYVINDKRDKAEHWRG